MKKIWYLKSNENSEPRCVKLFAYCRNGKPVAKVDLSAFAALGNLEADRMVLRFEDETGNGIVKVEFNGKLLLLREFLNGNGQMGTESAQKLENFGDYLEVVVIVGDEVYCSRRKKAEPEIPGIMAKPEEPAKPSEDAAEKEEMPEEKHGVRVVQPAVLEEEMEFRRYLNNSFFLHGYYNYGYVILDESNEETRLGVPGNFYEREKMVAGMFGFPHFEPAKEDETIAPGTFGYYFTDTK